MVKIKADSLTKYWNKIVEHNRHMIKNICNKKKKSDAGETGKLDIIDQMSVALH